MQPNKDTPIGTKLLCINGYRPCGLYPNEIFVLAMHSFQGTCRLVGLEDWWNYNRFEIVKQSLDEKINAL